jgi:hypothetical protein
MTPDSKSRIRAGEFDGVFKRFAVGHDCGAGDDAFFESSNDALVNASGETEVIRVDDKSFHPSSAQ